MSILANLLLALAPAPDRLALPMNADAQDILAFSPRSRAQTERNILSHASRSAHPAPAIEPHASPPDVSGQNVLGSTNSRAQAWDPCLRDSSPVDVRPMSSHSCPPSSPVKTVFSGACRPDHTRKLREKGVCFAAGLEGIARTTGGSACADTAGPVPRFFAATHGPLSNLNVGSFGLPSVYHRSATLPILVLLSLLVLSLSAASTLVYWAISSLDTSAPQSDSTSVGWTRSSVSMRLNAITTSTILVLGSCIQGCYVPVSHSRPDGQAIHILDFIATDYVRHRSWAN
ncbi:hypothetical protein DFH06DRAFT_1372247 [Mycena polygramma]|nr:hypothetical protein DFH06DRAFT_1372247 [Mycena polygramma]